MEIEPFAVCSLTLSLFLSSHSPTLGVLSKPGDRGSVPSRSSISSRLWVLIPYSHSHFPACFAPAAALKEGPQTFKARTEGLVGRWLRPAGPIIAGKQPRHHAAASGLC